MSAPTAKRELALVDLLNRLTKIQTAKGYNTDAGENLFIFEDCAVGEDDPLGIQVEVGPDSPVMSGRRIRAEVPIQIQALVYAPAFDAIPARIHALESLIADIKRAVEIDEGQKADLQHGLDGTHARGLRRGVTVPLKREPGSQFYGAAVEYIATIDEAWGEP